MSKRKWKSAIEKFNSLWRPSQKGGPNKLNFNILRLLILGWFLPLTMLSIMVAAVVSNRMQRQTEDGIVESSDTAVEACDMRLRASILASRNASYIPTIKESWYQYQRTGREQELYDNVYGFLSQMYKYDANFLSTIVYFCDRPDRLYYNYNAVARSGYDSVRFYLENMEDDTQKLAEELDTRIGFTAKDNHLYMVRNIVDKNFEPLAVITMELAQAEIFNSLKGIGWYEDSCVYIDDVCVYNGNGSAAKLAFPDSATQQRRSVYYEKDGTAMVCRTKKLEGHTFCYVVQLDFATIHFERNSMVFLLCLMLFFTVPLVGIIFRFLYKNVNDPVGRLVESAHEIEKGNYGYQIETQEKSEEFTYLSSAFNRMSEKLKLQFEQIYLEELALKEADIRALQSQINPHFLNNTLEIINWEARMNGNNKVSSMIEALSTMLEATLNRKKQPMIPLSEELNYVDAYCYIIKERFGEKLQFEKRIDQTLLREEVPRLIIQPIIENAVEHGLAGRRGQIMIRIYSEWDKLKIEVINDGTLAPKDEERIEMLLNGKEESERSVSVGISNVNKRLKIIYGADCGLTIKNDKNGHTISTIIVKMHK